MVANNPSEMCSTNTVQPYLLLAGGTVGNYLRTQTNGGSAILKIWMLVFTGILILLTSWEVVMAKLGCSTYHFHITLYRLDLCHPDVPTSRRGWHHILSVQEEEQSMDFREELAVPLHGTL